jgi:hypothetical protein
VTLSGGARAVISALAVGIAAIASFTSCRGVMLVAALAVLVMMVLILHALTARLILHFFRHGRNHISIHLCSIHLCVDIYVIDLSSNC